MMAAQKVGMWAAMLVLWSVVSWVDTKVEHLVEWKAVQMAAH